MNDLREKVARAILADAGVNPEQGIDGETAWSLVATDFDEWHAAIKEAGYAIVPREPTEEMLAEGLFAHRGRPFRIEMSDEDGMSDAYRAMLSAYQEGEE